MKLFHAVSLVFATSLVVACSGGGNSFTTNGNLCPSNYDPVPMVLGKDQAELKLDPADSQFPVGIYTYDHADLYYVDTVTDFRMHLQDTKQADGTYKTTINCLRNALPGMSGMSLSTSGVAGLDFSDGSKPPILDVKHFSFTVVESLITPITTVEKISGSPKDVYDTSKATETHFIKNNDTDFEIHSKGLGANGRGTYTLGIHLKLAPAPTPTPAKPATP